MIEIQNLRKEYLLDNGNIFKALKGIDYKVNSGAFFTMLGPSGCGKTTTLRAIAGLDQPTAGEIRFGNKVVYSANQKVFIAPEKRGLGMVFQSYAIWPHMTVEQNIAYPLESKKVSRREIKKLIEETLEMVGLAGQGKKLAPNLSGGQQQRVALARALVSKPEILLLDEPLSNLDAKLRGQMRHELKRLQKQIGQTTVYVTHDQEEALAMSDIIALMYEGQIVEIGSPFDLFTLPKQRFTAHFIGNSNFVQSKRIDSAADQCVIVENEFGRFAAIDYTKQKGEFCDLSFRPHNVQLIEGPQDDLINVGKGRVSDLLFLGENTEFHLIAGDKKIRLRTNPINILVEGNEVYFKLQAEHSIVYDLTS